MNKKTKLFCLMFAFVLIFSVGVFCVFAVTSLTFNMGGKVVFDADGVNAIISFDSMSGMELTNADKAYKLKDVVITTDMTSEQITQQASFSSWSNLAFELGETGEGTLSFKVKNTTDNVREIINTEISISGANQSVEITAGANQTIKLGETKSFSITFKVATTSYDLPETPFTINVKLSLASVADASSVSYSINNSGATLSQVSEIPQDGIYTVPEYVADENNNIYPVTKIGDNVYKNNIAIKSVVIPSCVKEIGEHAFSGCVNLESIVLSDNITDIYTGAFQGCTKLTAIRLPSKIKALHSNAFSGTGIIEIEFTKTSFDIGIDALGEKWLEAQPDGEVVAGSLLYKYKGTLTGHYEISSRPRSIGFYAFKNQTGLTSLTIPNNITNMNRNAFSGCTNLATINFPTSGFNITSSAFTDTAWYKNQPDGVIYVKNIALCYKGNLPEDRTITVKEGAVKIASEFCTFKNVTVVLPNTITSIAGYSFHTATGLNIVIPQNVTYIGQVAFANTDTDITIMATTPPTLVNINAFKKTNGEYATIYVPEGARDAYMAAANCKELNIVELS